MSLFEFKSTAHQGKFNIKNHKNTRNEGEGTYPQKFEEKQMQTCIIEMMDIPYDPSVLMVLHFIFVYWFNPKSISAFFKRVFESSSISSSTPPPVLYNKKSTIRPKFFKKYSAST